MKNPIMKAATVGLALGNASAFVAKPGPGSVHGAPDLALQAKRTGSSRIQRVSRVANPIAGRMARQSPSEMRGSIISTRREYPVGRDSRENELVAFGLQAFVSSMVDSAEKSITGASVSPGEAESKSLTLVDLVSHASKDAAHHGGVDVGGNVGHGLAASVHSLEHDAAQMAKNALHTHPHLDLNHQHSDHGSLASDALKALSLNAGRTVEGKTTTPTMVISGGLTLAALAGAAHGIHGADQLLMSKLQTMPAVYQYAAKMHSSIGSFMSHMESTGAAQSVKHGLVEIIKNASIETALDASDESALRTVKLNVKPVPGGPTLSMTLTASEKTEDAPNGEIKAKRKEFSVDIPGGGLTLAVPEVEGGSTSSAASGLPDTVPAVLSFVEKSSGAELSLAQFDIPRIR